MDAAGSSAVVADASSREAASSAGVDELCLTTWEFQKNGDGQNNSKSPNRSEPFCNLFPQLDEPTKHHQLRALIQWLAHASTAASNTKRAVDTKKLGLLQPQTLSV